MRIAIIKESGSANFLSGEIKPEKTDYQFDSNGRQLILMAMTGM